MIELKRKFYDFLLHWKMDKKQECLLVKGARQIGKTYIIRKFGRENYDEFVEINFVLNPEYMSVFEGNLESEQIISRITAIRPDVRFEAGKTLLFLDEIQECPNARTALKPLATTSRCDVIASGSLLGIKYKKSQLRKVPRSIPVGYERQVTMHSLSFEEYLWAQGYDDERLAYLRGFFERREMVPEAVNERFHQLLRNYVVIGGMPEVLAGFLGNHHYGDVQSVQEKILSAMIDDIHKYADKTDIPKVENCFRAIPRILAKENRKFKYAEVEDRGTARKYLSSVEWLKDAHIATFAECVNVALTGLSGYVKEEWFKLYLSDVGLLCSTYGMGVKREILADTLKGCVKGGIYENLVAGILERNGFPVRYYRNDATEVEFIVETSDGVVPIEVKASNGSTVSLDRLLESPDISCGIKLTGGNVGVSGKKLTLPHYMATFPEPVRM